MELLDINLKYFIQNLLDLMKFNEEREDLIFGKYNYFLKIKVDLMENLFEEEREWILFRWKTKINYMMKYIITIVYVKKR